MSRLSGVCCLVLKFTRVPDEDGSIAPVNHSERLQSQRMVSRRVVLVPQSPGGTPHSVQDLHGTQAELAARSPLPSTGHCDEERSQVSARPIPKCVAHCLSGSVVTRRRKTRKRLEVVDGCSQNPPERASSAKRS